MITLIKKLKGYDALVKENKRLESALKRSSDDLKNPVKVIEAIIGRKTKWIDYEAMDYGNKKIFYRSVLDLKENKAFKSLFGYEEDDERINGLIVKDFIEGAVLESTNWQMVRDMQMSINGVECIWKYLDEIYDPDLNKKKADSNIED